MLNSIRSIRQVDHYLGGGDIVALYFYLPIPSCGESYRSCIQDIAENMRPPHIVFLSFDFSDETLETDAKERFRVANVPQLLILGGTGNNGQPGQYRALVTSALDVRNALANAAGLQFPGGQ